MKDLTNCSAEIIAVSKGYKGSVEIKLLATKNFCKDCNNCIARFEDGTIGFVLHDHGTTLHIRPTNKEQNVMRASTVGSIVIFYQESKPDYHRLK